MGQVAQVGGRVADRYDVVLLAPKQERRGLDAGQRRCGVVQDHLTQARQNRPPDAGRQQEVAIAGDGRLAQRLRARIGCGQTGLHKAARRDIGQRPHDEGRLGGVAIGEARAGEAVRGDQHQAGHTVGMQGGKVRDDSPAEGMADKAGADDAQLVHQSGQDLRFAGVGIVASGVGASQTEARQVETDDTVARRQCLSPRLPGVQAGAEAVQQDHRRGVTRPTVTQTKAHPFDCAVVAGIGRLQRVARLVGGVEPNGQRDGRQRGQPGQPESEHRRSDTARRAADVRLPPDRARR